MTSPSASKRHSEALIREEAGFSFLSVAILIGSLTAGLATAYVMMDAVATSGAAAATTATRLENLRAAAHEYRSHMGALPQTLDRLVNPGSPACAPDTNASSATFRQLRGWCGPYLDDGFGQRARRDGWNTLVQWDGARFLSCGPNRTCGDGDDLRVDI